MKKFNLAKVISLVFVCVMLLGALSLSVFATEDETVEVVKHNMYYGDTYQIMYAIKAPDGITVKATDSKGNEINVVPFAERPTDIVAGVECKIYILEKGVAAQAIDEVITLTITYNNKTVVDNYSILQYIYERSQAVEGAELEMLQALLNFAIKADIFLDKVTTSFDIYQYVSVEGATVNGANPTGMYAPGATPFANIDAIEYDAEKYELAVTVNGIASTLDALKALVVADEAINVVVEIVEKTHVHNYTPKVTDPTCTADGYTTFTCEECGDSYTEAGETAKGHAYDEKVTDPTCTADGYTTKTCATCGDVQTIKGDPATGHKDENGDYKCDVCSTIELPAADSTLTIKEAIAVAKAAGTAYTTGKYYVTGTVKNIYNTQYGNMYITDGTNEICVYGLYSADGKTRYDAMAVKPIEGETITVYGKLGMYSTTSQFKDGWMTEHEVHECDFSVAATCTKGVSCALCGAEEEGSEALGHDYSDATCNVKATCSVCGETTGDFAEHNMVDGVCTVCGHEEGEPEGPKELATFEFGANGSAAHVDGNDFGTSKTYTDGDYTLKLTGMSKVFGPAYDAKGNSCIKLGTSKAVGGFTFTVADDVDQVIIRVAGYKAASGKVTINGTTYTISEVSNNGAYKEIVIDTTTTKTITFVTVTYRAMINSITFIG